MASDTKENHESYNVLKDDPTPNECFSRQTV
jgi:hypothetical protein